MLYKNKIIEFIKSHLKEYGTPSSLNYVWSLGFLAGIMLVIQIISGLFMTMHYTPDTAQAFSNLIEYSRNGSYGWALRSLHANGASFFFMVVYAHIVKALFYGSYFFPRQKVWYSGLVIFLLMMGTAFIGYVLPWGQMSYWGATVITNLFTAIPFIGEAITKWLWGGFAVDSATLVRFATIHYTLPWILLGLVALHLALLHKVSSNNPNGSEKAPTSPFGPYYMLKDSHSLLFVVLLIVIIITFYPNSLGHPDNYIPADPLVTPKHIVPEWYFLPFYAILRSIPHKTGGVVGMAGAIIILFCLPFFNTSKIRNSYFRPVYSFFLACFIGNFITLGWLGQMPVESPYDQYGLYCTIFYFLFFIVLVPAAGKIETFLMRNDKKKSNCLLESKSTKVYKNTKKI